MKKQVSIVLKNSVKFLIILFLFTQLGCNKSEYTKLVNNEMAKNIVNDSLIFGMTFGQTRKLFFDQCWKLNNQKIINQGSSNNFVEYQLPKKKGDSLNSPITLLFYGIFNKEKIMTGMDMKFRYVAWSLWNKSLQSDKLVPVVKDSLKTWFPGNDFIVIPAKKTKGEIHVKIDGNRRILIEPITDSRTVDVRIDDLRYVLDKIN
mgnify:FL=1|jgi:hypothetical protein